MSKTIYIFLSSTFKDMHYERDYIRKYVVPSVNEQLRDYDIDIRIVDLRWGINTSEDNEDVREAKILKVCIDEIRRTKPYFIGIIGDRTGWIPPKEKWNYVHNRMPKNEYELFVDIYPISVTGLEVMYSINSCKAANNSLFFIRSNNSYKNLTQQDRLIYNNTIDRVDSSASNGMLLNLKQFIYGAFDAKTLPKHVTEYEFDIASKQLSGLSDFGHKLEDMLLNIIKRDHVKTHQEASKTEREQRIFDAFVERNIENFIGRESIIENLTNTINSSPKVTLLISESGNGKSALFCRLVDNYRKSINKTRIVLEHSAGISIASANSNFMLESWCNIISSKLGITETTENVVERFKNLCNTASNSKIEIWILLDSVDRLDNSSTGKFLNWINNNMYVLLTSLPESAKSIISAHSNVNVVQLPPFSSSEASKLLSLVAKDNGKELYSTIVEKVLLKIQDQVCTDRSTDDIINFIYPLSRSDYKYAHQSPLWLMLVSGIIFNLDADDFKEIEQRNEPTDEGRIVGFFSELIDDFECDPGKLFLQIVQRIRKDFGQEFTDNILSLIAVSKSGLSDEHIEQMLESQFDSLTYAQLKRYLSSFLTVQGEERCNVFTHSILKEAILNYITAEQSFYYHKVILEYACKTKNYLHKHSFNYHALNARDIKASQEVLRHSYNKTNEYSRIIDICEFIALDPVSHIDYICEVLGSDSEMETGGYRFSDPVFLKGTLANMLENLIPQLKEYCDREIVKYFIQRLYVVSDSVVNTQVGVYIPYLIDSSGETIINDSQSNMSIFVNNTYKQIANYKQLVNQGLCDDAKLLATRLTATIEDAVKLSPYNTYLKGMQSELYKSLVESKQLSENDSIALLHQIVDICSSIDDKKDYNYGVVVTNLACACGNLSTHYEYIDIDKALHYSNKGIAHLDETTNSMLLLQFKVARISLYATNGQFQDAIDCADLTIKQINERFNNNPNETEYILLIGRALSFKLKAMDELHSDNSCYDETYSSFVDVLKRLKVATNKYDSELSNLIKNKINNYLAWVFEEAEDNIAAKHRENILIITILLYRTENFVYNIYITIDAFIHRITKCDNIIEINNLNKYIDIMLDDANNLLIDNFNVETNYLPVNIEEKFELTINKMYNLRLKLCCYTYWQDGESSFFALRKCYTELTLHIFDKLDANTYMLINNTVNEISILKMLEKLKQTNEIEYNKIDKLNIDFIVKNAFITLKNTVKRCNKSYLYSRYEYLKSTYAIDEII